MSLLPFLLVTLGGSTVVLLVRTPARLHAALGWVVLVGAVLTALAVRPDEVMLLGGSGLATTTYLQAFLLLGAVVGLLLALVGATADPPPHVAGVSAAILGTSALALALPDPRLAVLAATAGGVVGALLTIGDVASRARATIGTRVLRATIVAGTMAIAAAAWIGRDLSDLAAQPIVFGLAYLAMALAVAIRFGAIPFHTWSARLTDAVPETALPLATAIAPAALAVVALAWTDASIAPLLVDLDQVRAVVLAIAVASILLGALAAWIQDDIEHIVGYSIVGDAGVLLLAVAALDPAAWAPARIWILAFIAARSAFAAWAGATRTTFATGRVDDLRGWAIRSPGLGIALGLVIVASIGLPGLAAFEARASLVDLALDGPLATIVFLGALTPIAYYARLLVVGVERPDRQPVERIWRPTLEPIDMTDLQGWAGRGWSANRAVTATAGALVLAVVAIGVSAGAFGGPAAAVGLPPSLDAATGSFTPDGPTGPGEPGPETAPEASDSAAPEASDAGASEPGAAEPGASEAVPSLEASPSE